MSGIETAAALAVALTALYLAALALGRAEPGRRAWMIPAALSAAFLAYTVWTVAAEGPTGFWSLHVTSLWGLQVWTDLLLAAACAATLLVPEARRLGLDPRPWVAATMLTGSVGLLAFLAVVLRRRAQGR